MDVITIQTCNNKKTTNLYKTGKKNLTTSCISDDPIMLRQIGSPEIGSNPVFGSAWGDSYWNLILLMHLIFILSILVSEASGLSVAHTSCLLVH